jgi:N-acetylneuraminate lyase
MATIRTGVYAALLTPFDEEDRVCLARLRDHLAFLVEGGVQGVYVCGNSGQGLFLSVPERRRILETVVEQVGGRIGIIAHVAAIATRDALELARHASELAVDAVASLPPVYWTYSPEEILAYYRALAAASKRPLIIYHRPGGGGQSLHADTLAELTRIPEIGGIKFTDPDFFQLQRLLDRSEGRWVAFSGPDELFLPALTMGVAGCIGTTQNAVPGIFRFIHDCFGSGRMDAAMDAQHLITELVGLYWDGPGTIPVAKALLRARGIDPGYCRPPVIRRVDASTEDRVAAVFAEVQTRFEAMQADASRPDSGVELPLNPGVSG